MELSKRVKMEPQTLRHKELLEAYMQIIDDIDLSYVNDARYRAEIKAYQEIIKRIIQETVSV